MSDLSSLSAALPENLSQLAQLDELLESDPTNAELLSIRDDLKQVIQMTIELQKAAGQLPPEEAAKALAASTKAAASAAPAEPRAEFEEFTPGSSSTTASSHSLVSSQALGSMNSAAAASSAIYNTPMPATAASAMPINGIYPAGSRVMAHYAKDDRYYVARIDRVDEGLEQYTITYLEYNQTASVGFDEVRPWISATHEQLKMQNTPVKAMFPEDGIFYNASIDGPSSQPGYYVVKFGHLGTKKKKKVEVPIYDIIINERFMNPNNLQLTSAASAGSKAAATAQLKEEFPTPEHLIVLPTDTDSIKQQKIKKLKKLKFEHRKAYEEQESNKRKNSWQDFKAGKTLVGQGASKKQKLTHVQGLQQVQKQSIFATPDSGNGVVGVIGSGRGMTDHAAIKKHVFAAEEAKQQ